MEINSSLIFKNSKDIWIKFLKGFLVGLIILLPGMSGGTLILLLGLYETLMRDLVKLRLIPWIPFAFGLGAGIVAGGWIFTYLMESFEIPIMGILLGFVLASSISVLHGTGKPGLRGILSAAVGLAGGIYISGFTQFDFDRVSEPNVILIVAGAAISSAAMLLPGVPGSAFLIIMGIYDDVMIAVGELDFRILAFFAIGALVGIAALAKLLDFLYTRNKKILSWFFAGLIIGSARILVPSYIDNCLVYFLMTLIGFAGVIILDKKYAIPDDVNE